MSAAQNEPPARTIFIS